MDASLEFLLNNLKHMLYDSDLIQDAKFEFEQLNIELDGFKELLKIASKKYKRDEIYKQWEREIREVVYDIENTIDTYVTHMDGEAAKKGNHFKRLLMARPATIAERIKSIRRTRVQPLLNNVDFKLFTVAVADTTVDEARESRRKRSQNIVGFEAEASELIDFLTRESSKLEIASIVGMAGLGKTTLAWKIFDHPRIQYEYPVRIWVNISEDLNIKDILLRILRKFHYNYDARDESVKGLIIRTRHHLKTRAFFIVMDDIWTISAWNKIKEILPRDNHKGRVLVTTRHNDVAEYSTTRIPHYLRLLTPPESWQLLQCRVFDDPNGVPKELESLGLAIAKDCNGLPLSIVVIGGILVEKKSRVGNNISALKKEWAKVSTNVKSYLVDGDKKKLLMSVISLSFEKISFELKNCFLYLGVFPENADIHVKELVRLWIAEGFILGGNGRSLEQIALSNLKELINRNLVMVKEAKFDGEPKICHIHNSVHEICNTEAKYENLNLFQEITRSHRGFEPRNNIEKLRRLCIHSYTLDFLMKTKKIPNARSFLCFDQSSIILEPTDMSCIIDCFGLLRVYDAKNIKFPKFPQKFVQLVHLRYLTLVIEHCTSLPEVISKLWNLQTLIMDVSSSTLVINADIGKMRQLRHLKTKSSIMMERDERGEGSNNLQTLSRLCPESCTDIVFKQAKNLITLGIQGQLNKLVSFKCLRHLDHLYKLKLVNEVPNGVAAESPFRPQPNCFQPNLKILALSATYMHWTEISMIAKLGSLEVLKLKNNAFVGSYWEIDQELSIFHRLKYLHIERSTDLVCWKTRGHPFPKLRFLLLNNCEKLIEVPSDVCENLEKLCMERVTKDLISFAGTIAEQKHKQRVAFKLDIKLQKA